MNEARVLRAAGAKVKEIFQNLLGASDVILEEIITKGKASKYFSDFTGGRYTSVELFGFSLRARDISGREWEFAALSAGTKDQLLLALRLALAEKLLRAKGFLIFDDALVTSDRERLR